MPQNWWDGFQLFCWMVGAGGIPTVVVALVGRKKARELTPPAMPPPVPPMPVEMSSPWLVQNLLEMKLTIEGIKKNQDSLVSSVNAMAVQVHALSAKLRVRKTTK